MPLACFERILQQALEILYRIIVSRQYRCEVNSSARFSDSGIKVVVLVPD